MAGISVKENWQSIQIQIARLSEEKGQNYSGVKILGVTKRQGRRDIEEALKLGLKNLGENYAQDLVRSQSDFPGQNIVWHFIGHIQSNKVKSIVGNVDLIHSVDRKEIALAISKAAVGKELIQKILIEVNIDNEPTKSGVAVEEALNLIHYVQTLPGIQLCGLMCMPAPANPLSAVRIRFAALRNFRDSWAGDLHSGDNNHHLTELSMGTSEDFHYALEEGATIIRLGTAIFGDRETRG